MMVKLQDQEVSVYPLRLRQLVDDIKMEFPGTTAGLILLIGNFEEERHVFRQESSFYYFTGIQEPGAVALIDLDRSAFLMLPQFSGNRTHWVYQPYELSKEQVQQFGFHDIQPLGEPCDGYQSHPFFDKRDYTRLLKLLEQRIARNETIFTLYPSSAHGYVYQRLIIDRLISFLPGLASKIVDVSPIAAHIRRTKDMRELEAMYQAVHITMLAHETSAQTIGNQVPEHDVQATIEYVFSSSGATYAFPSIVGSGYHSTTLHYNVNNGIMNDGDLVVIDIGAQYQYYCADITRTYPVSGTFTPRQKEIYSLVLETQNYIASIAKPGYWLSSKEHPDRSLNHLAHKYIRERGYGDYFPHNIGHFLGLDVHDVGDYARPLQEGDVITIEPGIYIPEEKLGVRIEDNYWLGEEGVVCLSQELPKEPHDIEQFMVESKRVS
jgi:Xaa-Pro aminopeptidase